MNNETELEILYELVKNEAENLKLLHATKKELSLLSLERLSPNHRSKCIYGQMTGDCISDRAEELIIKCNTQVYVSLGKDIRESTLSNIPNGHRFEMTFFYFTPIEKFLYVANDINIGLLVKYLKGEISELNFQ